MESKVVVVTGASSGIGSAIAVHLATVGYRKLVIVARREQKLREVAEQCKAESKGDDVDVLVVVMDLSVPENNAEVVKKTIQHFGSKTKYFRNLAGIVLTCTLGKYFVFH